VDNLQSGQRAFSAQAVQRPDQQDLEFTLPGITVNLAQHLLMATSPGRFLQFIYLDNFPATTTGPSLKIRRLIVGMLARIAYTKPYTGFLDHEPWQPSDSIRFSLSRTVM